MTDYYGRGWTRSGPLPDAVSHTLGRSSETQIRDPVTGHTWTADGKNTFTRTEVTVAFDTPVSIPVRAAGDELARVGALQRDAVQSNDLYGSRLIAERYERSRAQAEPAGQGSAWAHCRAAFEPSPAESVDVKRGLLALPPLLKAYLRTGARFGHAAVLDRQFGTTDVFAVMPMGDIEERYLAHYGQPSCVSGAPVA